MCKVDKHLFKVCGVLFFSAILSACGGGSGNGSAGGGNNGTATFSLGITDGPVDEAENVWVQFDGVELYPASGEVITFDFDSPQSIDLLALQGNSSEMLLMNETIPAGEYNAIRLMVSAEFDGVLDSYLVDTNFDEWELRIPSGSQTGLKLNTGFVLAAGSISDFTIDFDLRKSVTNPPGQDGYLLKPSLRLVDNLTVGTVFGDVSDELLALACGDSVENNGAVYLFSGAVDAASDISGAETDPLASAIVDEEGNYEIGFVASGEYSAAYTCGSSVDDPEVVDELVFYGLTTLEVTENLDTEVNFEAPPAGTVSGVVSADLLALACEESAESNGAVYLYTGAVDPATDIRGAETDPLTTAMVDGEGNYGTDLVAPGQYSAAYTCESSLDDPEVEDELVFYGLSALEVTDDMDTQVNFDAPTE